MKIPEEIRKQRHAAGLSQEALADRLYVTRQTVSNWETGKTYPDLDSLIRMSSLFHTSVDELIGEDLPRISAESDRAEIRSFRFHAAVYAASAAAVMIGAWILPSSAGMTGVFLLIILASAGAFSALKVQRIRSRNRLGTFREIKAFLNSEPLPRTERIREEAKQPYQEALKLIAVMLLSTFLSMFLHS